MKQVFVIAVIIPLFISAGCDQPKEIMYTAPIPPNTNNTREVNGLKVTIDPVVNNDRSKQYFGTNALTNGIFPIYVSAENTNPNATFLFQKENVSFAGQSDGGVSAGEVHIDSQSDSRQLTGLIAPGLVLANTILTGDISAMQHNFVRLELRDQTLSPGQSTAGFIYFNVPKSFTPADGILKITVTDVRNQKTTFLEVPITNELLKY